MSTDREYKKLFQVMINHNIEAIEDDDDLDIITSIDDLPSDCEDEDYFEDTYDELVLQHLLNKKPSGVKVFVWDGIYKSGKPKGKYLKYPTPSSVANFIALIEDNKWGEYVFPEFITIADDGYLNIHYST